MKRRGNGSRRVFNSVNIILVALLVIEVVFVFGVGITGNPVKGIFGEVKEIDSSPVNLQNTEKTLKTVTTSDGHSYNLNNYIGDSDRASYVVDEAAGKIYISSINPVTQDIENEEINLKQSDGYLVQLSDDPVVKYQKIMEGKGALSSSSVKSYKNGLVKKQLDVEKQIQFLSEEVKIGKSYQKVFNGFKIDKVSDKDLEKIQKLPNVKKIYPNYKVYANLMDSVPLIGADKLWNQEVGGSPLNGEGITIGIIDTGVDYTHPDLGGCFGVGCKVEGGYDFVNYDDDPMDDHGHGTHVASTAAGEGTLNGVAPGATIYAYKVLNSGGSGTWEGVIAGIERSTDPNQDGDFSDHLNIISLSLGASCWDGYNEECGPDDIVSQAIDNAVDIGVVAVIAAGNSGPSSGTIGSPGTARKAITVAATYKKDYEGPYWQDVDPRVDQITSFSSRGPVELPSGEIVSKPDVAAPGAIICAAQWDNAWSDRECLDDEHTAISGTSMATPHVAGAVALLKQRQPLLTPQQIKDTLKATAIDIGYDEYTQGAGRIDIFAAAGGDIKAIMKPFSKTITITPTQRYVTKTDNFEIKNLLNQTLNFNLSIENNNTGINVSLSKTNVFIPPAGSDLLIITGFSVTVDNDVLINNKAYKFYIVARSGDYVLRLPVKVYIENSLKVNQDKIDLGIVDPEVREFGVSGSFNVQNIRLDSSKTYQAKIDFTSWESHSGINSWNYDMDDEMKQYLEEGFSLSQENLIFTPSENKIISINGNFTNFWYGAGVYKGNIILNSTTNIIKIPFSFTKYYILDIDFDEGNGSLRPWLTEVYNNYSLQIIGAYEGPQKVYLYYNGSYGVVNMGSKEKVGEPGNFDFAYNFDSAYVDKESSYFGSLASSTRKIIYNVKDANGQPLYNDGFDGELTNKNSGDGGIGNLWFGNVDGGTVLFLSNKFSDNWVYDAATYKFIDQPKYYISERVSTSNEDFQFSPSTNNYQSVKLKFNYQYGKQFIPTYGSASPGGSLTFWPSSQQVMNDEGVQDIIVNNKNGTSYSGFFAWMFDASEFNDGWWGHEPKHETPILNIENNELTKGFYSREEGKTYVEKTSSKEVQVGLGPEFWYGRMNIDYPDSVIVDTKKGIEVRWYFLGQNYDSIYHEDMPYSIYSGNDSTQCHSGNYCAKSNTDACFVPGLSAEAAWWPWQADIFLEPDTNYTLSFWAKKGTGTSQLIEMTTRNKTDTGYIYGTWCYKDIISGSWEQFTCTFKSANLSQVAPSWIVFGKIKYSLNPKAYPNTGANVCTIFNYLDDVELKKVGSNENIIENPGFEKVDGSDIVGWRTRWSTTETTQDSEFIVWANNGMLYGVNEYSYHSWGYWINLPQNKSFTFNLTKDYVIDNKTYYGKVKIKFNNYWNGNYPYTADWSPPYLDSLKVLCDGVSCDTLVNGVNKINFIPNASKGTLTATKLYYLKNNAWTEIPGSMAGGKYEATLPSLTAGTIQFKLYLEDNSKNSLEYIFGLPKVDPPKPVVCTKLQQQKGLCGTTSKPALS